MLWILLLLLPSVASCFTVETSFGDIEGFEHITENGIQTHVFLGVRYGKAPDGQGRFKKPELVDKWAPSLYTAKKFGAACFPFTEILISDKESYSEDCLFVNIITPKLSGADLPVFVFIHGGGFEFGSSTEYGYKRLAERVASEGIVVVTINYRLGPFGFFSLGDSAAPGNMGLWDQTLALKFLNEVLPSFGGDISQITIGGQSGGSMSSSALHFSPHSRSLFSQAVLMSGSTLVEKLVEQLGCEEKTTSQSLACLQERSAREIIQAVGQLGLTRRHPNFLMYHPRFDGEFFPEAIDELAKTSPRKRTLAGVADQEGALFALYEEFSFLIGLVVPKSDWNTYSRDDLIEFIETVVVTDQEHGAFAPAFRRQLIEFYVEKDEKKGNSSFYLQRYSDLIGDLLFLMPLYNEAQIKLASNWPTFLYILEHSMKGRDEYPVKGTWHGDEPMYFTNFPGLKEQDPESDALRNQQLQETDTESESFGLHFVTALVNFIKNGDPSSLEFSWPPINKEHPFLHASITSNISLKRKPYRPDAAQLWLEIVPNSVSVDALRRSRLPGTVKYTDHSEL